MRIARIPCVFVLVVMFLALAPHVHGQQTASVTGTITYRERIALPDAAAIVVRLVDVSRADAPAVVLAEQRSTAGGKQVPFPFTLPYDPTQIQENGIYAVEASITVDGQLRFLNTSLYRVITQGNPTNIDLVLEQVGTNTPTPTPQSPLAAEILDRDWSLVSFARAAGNAEDTTGKNVSIRFTGDGKVSGSGGCNSFFGTYTTGAQQQLTIANTGATLKACTPDVMALENAYFDALKSVASYLLDASGLHLSFNNGQGMLNYSTAAPQSQGTCFSETGHCVSGRFLEYWQQNGGLAVFGLPLSDALTENERSVQYFERQRFELHAENAAPYDVLLGRLGDELLRRQGVDWTTLPKADGEQQGCRFFAETQHRVCNLLGGPGFLSYWSNNGLEFDGRRGTSAAESLALFGLPISEPFETTIEGKRLLVQWFERARFEYHPDNPAASRVLLGRLGAELRGDAPLAGAPSGGEETTMVSIQRGDNGKAVTLTTGQTLVVTLDSNPSTGYAWQVKAVDSAILQQQGEPEYTPGEHPPGSVGGGGTLTFRFRALAAGQTTLTLVYVRSFEPEVQPTPENTFTVPVTVR